MPRVAVVGLGYWGPNLARVVAESESAELAWLCDIDEASLRKVGRRHPSTRLTTDLEDVLADPRVDAVLISTPVFSHFELGSRSLRAGKSTFVEKPLASTSAEADLLAELAAEHGVHLMCGHTFLYSPPVNKVRDLLRRGELGQIYFISSSRVNLGLHQRDISVIWDLGPHDFSILLHWLGEMPTSVRASGRDLIVQGIPDVAFVTLEFASGLLVNVELSWLAPSKLRRTVVVGSEKMVVYADGASEPVRIYDSGVVYRDPETFGEYHLSYRTGDITSPQITTGEPLVAEMEAFLALLRNERSGAEELALARDVICLLEAAERSLQNGGAPVATGTLAEIQ